MQKNISFIALVVFTIMIFSPIFPKSFDCRLMISELIYKIRDPKTQDKDFRNSLKKLGEYLALETMEELATKESKIQTLLGKEASHVLVEETPVLVTILRAGIPLYLGVQKIFPNAETGFLAMSRDEETLKPSTEYIALPEIKNKTVVIVDTMIATAGSILNAVQIIEQYEPKKIIIIGAMASEFGIQKIKDHNPLIKIYVGTVDALLNEKGYIVPGLGDAGDRAYGNKVIRNRLPDKKS